MTRKNVSAYGIYGPSVYALNKAYNPAYASLGNYTTESTLFGTPQSVEKRMIPVYHDGRWINHLQKYKVPAQAGLLDMYKRAGADMAQFNREQQAQDLNAFRESNPLFGSLMNRAQQGLDQGGELDASTRRTLEQAALGDASLRGFGHSPLDAYQAYASMGAASEARKREREQFALQAQGLYDPFRPSMASTLGPALGMQGAAWGRTSSTPVMNPFAQNGIQTIPSDNTTSNILGAVSGGLLNMAGGIGGMGGGGQRGPNNAMYYPAQGNGGTYYR